MTDVATSTAVGRVPLEIGLWKTRDSNYPCLDGAKGLSESASEHEPRFCLADEEFR